MIDVLKDITRSLFLLGAGFAFGLLLLTRCAEAAPTKVDTAAIAALTQAFNMPHGHEVEYGGAIFDEGKGLEHTLPPHTDAANDHVQLNPQLVIPPGAKFLAVFHTHPCMPTTHYPEYFSPQDIGMALLVGVPSYVLNECTGEVHVYDPSADMPTGVVPPARSDDAPNAFSLHLFAGRLVGNIGAKGEDQDAANNSIMHIFGDKR
jgi:hypothetical protein